MFSHSFPRRGKLLPALFRQALIVASTGLALSVSAQTAISIDPSYHHLGDSEVKDWPGVAVKPEGTSLKREFSVAAPMEGTIRLKQRDIHGVWRLLLNGREIAQLDRVAAERISHYPVPASMLVAGVNVLEVTPDNKTDDMAVGVMEFVPTPMRVLLDLRPVLITITQTGSKQPVPARIFITDQKGDPIDIHFAGAPDRAVRPGILYTRGTLTSVELARGRYVIAATRGMEWSRDVREIDISGPATAPLIVDLKLRREVDTKGYVAADTHIHTFTHSAHGNSTMEERMISLAGEGVELAVATDHHHQIDYIPTQKQLNLSQFFTSVVGNEISTANGHFNAFPMDPNGSVPDKNETDWVKLIESFRVRGARVVILNHPRWPDMPRNPFTKAGLNRASGDRVQAGAFTFDAMELVNSTALLDDPMYLFLDWFGLLNKGEKIKAVGSSDTHTVDDPVGQGRTYAVSSTDVASQVNVDEFCRNLLAGRASVSMGIFTDVRVDGRYVMGDTLPVKKGAVSARLRVAAPSWITPQKAMAFLNGVKIAEMSVPHKEGTPTDVKLNFQLPVRDYDSHLIFVVLGKGVKAPGWTTYKDYTLAATNPVYLDADGDGSVRSVREEAVRRLGDRGGQLDFVNGLLSKSDPALGVQIASVASRSMDAQTLAGLRFTLDRLAGTNEMYALYVRHLPQVSK